VGRCSSFSVRGQPANDTLTVAFACAKGTWKVDLRVDMQAPHGVGWPDASIDVSLP
jgi:hypothetical protein